MPDWRTPRRILIPAALAAAALALGAKAVLGQAAASPAAPAVPEAPGGLQPGVFFVHTAISPNTAAAVTYLNHPLLNLNPGAVFLATQNWNPNGALAGVYNPHEIGVFYSAGQGKWTVFNESGADMTEGASFNIHIPPTGTATLVHTSTIPNISDHWTDIDHAPLNGQPQVLVYTLHSFNPGGGPGAYFNRSLGVWYRQGGRWAVFTQDESAMPAGMAFNVFFREAGPDAFVHTAAAASLSGHSTYLDHPLVNGRPEAALSVTQRWQSGVYNPHPIGVWYDLELGRWAIFNQDEAAMPEGAAFNVLVDIRQRQVYLPLAVR